MPADIENPLWRRTAWWIQLDDFLKEKGCKPRNLDEFVEWSQKQQADGLALAVRTCKSRFPKCGGVIIWMGHDAFPCTANTSVLNFNGEPNPPRLKSQKFSGKNNRTCLDTDGKTSYN